MSVRTARPQALPLRTPTYSILNRGIARDVLPVTQRHGMGTIVYSPPAQGMLTGRVRKGRPSQLTRSGGYFTHLADEQRLEVVERLISLATDAGIPLTHLAVAFVLTHPVSPPPCSDRGPPEQPDDLLAATDVALDDDLLDRIHAIVAPGFDVGRLQMAYDPPAVTEPAQRRRPLATARSHPRNWHGLESPPNALKDRRPRSTNWLIFAAPVHHRPFTRTGSVSPGAVRGRFTIHVRVVDGLVRTACALDTRFRSTTGVCCSSHPARWAPCRVVTRSPPAKRCGKSPQTTTTACTQQRTPASVSSRLKGGGVTAGLTSRARRRVATTTVGAVRQQSVTVHPHLRGDVLRLQHENATRADHHVINVPADRGGRARRLAGRATPSTPEARRATLGRSVPPPPRRNGSSECTPAGSSTQTDRTPTPPRREASKPRSPRPHHPHHHPGHDNDRDHAV